MAFQRARFRDIADLNPLIHNTVLYWS